MFEDVSLSKSYCYIHLKIILSSQVRDRPGDELSQISDRAGEGLGLVEGTGLYLLPSAVHFSLA